MSQTILRALRFRPFDVELTTPFGIATGSQALARNVVVEIELEGGTVGLGEAAPFPAVNGETQEAVLAALASARDALVGLDAARFRLVASAVREACPQTPTAWCAVETAVLDAFARHHATSLWHFFGGAEPSLDSDITLVTGSADAAARAAEEAGHLGFSLLKVKIGGVPLDDDVARLLAVAGAAPGCRWLLDGNTAFSEESACALLDGLGPERARVVLFEQPGPAGDDDTPRRIHERTGVPVAADESVQTSRDVARLAAARASQVVNVKVSKSGVLGALDIIATARAHGLGLMVGGMVESKIAMTLSACLAAGQGGFSFVDLDTPLFMKGDVTAGGFEQHGARLWVDKISEGHGVRVVQPGSWWGDGAGG